MEGFEEALDACRQHQLVFKGPLISDQSYDINKLQSTNFLFHKQLDIYATVAIIRSIPGTESRVQNLDFAVIRERTEGEFTAYEHSAVPGVVESLKVTTRKKAERVAKFAFDYAVRNKRKSVCAVHKANIMKKGDGLFLSACRDVSEMYPNIEFSDMIIDNASMQMVSNPQQFDVIVTPNLYGNILTNIGTGLVGGAGTVASYSCSDQIMMFETAGGYPYFSAAGMNRCNPTASILCASMMADHIGYEIQGFNIRKALYKTIKTGKYNTRDQGGYCSTTDFTDAVIERL